MALPGSGTLRFSDIRDEFGGSNPAKLSDYYRGGALVPDTSANTSVPTSGTIKISDFYGASAIVFTPGFIDGLGNSVSSTDITADAFNVSSLTMGTNGAITIANGLPNVTPVSWGDPVTTGIGSSYEVMFDTVIGTVTVPSVNTWIALSTARAASYTEGNGGASFRIRIRPNGGSVAGTLNVSFLDSGGF